MSETETTIDWKALAEPFPPEDIEWRIKQGGKSNNGLWAMVLAYVTNRAIQERLDEVVGAGNWKNQYMPGPDGGVMCGISIRNELGEWITKWDGAENTEVESIKGGFSGSMKRAAVQWGIGRYLYHLETGWADFDVPEKQGRYRTTVIKGDKTYYDWNPPKLPYWAQPGGEGKPPARPENGSKPKANGKKPAAKHTDPNGSDLPDPPANGGKGDSRTPEELYRDAVAKIVTSGTEEQLDAIGAAVGKHLKLSSEQRMDLLAQIGRRKGQIEQNAQMSPA